MPIFEVEANGKTYEVEAPDAQTAGSTIAKMAPPAAPVNDIEQFVGKGTPSNGPINVDQGGKTSPLDALLKLPALRGTIPYRIAQGMADPALSVAQMAGHAVGKPEGIDSYVNQIAEGASVGRGYDPARGDAPFDPARMAGNIAIIAPMAAALTPAAGPGMGSQMLAGASAGARFGLLNPVEHGSDNFLVDKAKQGLAGAVGGAVAAPITAGIGRVLAPKGNAVADDLAAKGVQPTIGQRLGGAWNSLEEKAMSVPIIGDAIGAARNRARVQFNTAAINEAIAPIKQTVKGAGFDAVDEAHRAVSSAYDDALAKLKGVALDNQLQGELASLRGLAGNMPDDMAKAFEKTLANRILNRVSPAGGIEAQTFKEIDSELDKLAAEYMRSSLASERQLGGAFAELSQILTHAAGRQNPQAAGAVKAADDAFARLIRIENAAKAAKSTEGVFTPGQLLSGVMQADRSARKNAVGRGTSLMQKFASDAQQVLGNKVPDSGTTGRALGAALLAGGVGGAAGAGVPGGLPALLALGGGAALYSPQSQKLLAAALRSRPVMEPFAQALRQYAPVFGAQLAPAVVSGQ